MTRGNNLWMFLSYLLWSNFVKTAVEVFLFSDFTRMSTMKHKCVSLTSLLGLCFPFVSIVLTLTWTFAMAADPGSENPSFTTLQLSLSLPGSALCLVWHSQPDMSLGGMPSSSLGFPRVASQSLLLLEMSPALMLHTAMHSNISHIPCLTDFIAVQ